MDSVDDALEKIERLYDARITQLLLDKGRLVKRVAELERENRTLWAASGKLRQGFGVLWAAVDAGAEHEEACELESDADDLLSRLVPLSLAKS